jgi:hypothetical protein
VSWPSFAPGEPAYPYAWRDFDASPVAVSTETPIMALVELGLLHSDVVITLRNHGAVTAALFVEQSESGVVNDSDRERIDVPAGKERTIEFRDVMRRMFGVTASGDPDGGFPATTVSVQVVVRKRIR